MNAKFIAIVAVCALVVVGSFFYFSNSQPKFGAAITAYNCLNNAALCNSLNSITSDLVNVQGNLLGLTTSTSWNPPAISTTTIATTTLNLTCTAGDPVFAELSNATATLNGAVPTLTATCGVSNTVNVTLAFPSGAPNGTLDYPTGTLQAWTKPAASFLTPPSIITTTSTNF